MENKHKKELIQLTLLTSSLYLKLNNEDKKKYKKDFFNIDKIFEKLYDRIK